MSQRSARPGATSRLLPRVSRSSKMRSSMRSDCASRPMRGSRLVGLLSMIITRVLGSGLLAQEISRKQAAQARTRIVFVAGKKKQQVPRLVSARERASTFARDDRLLWHGSCIRDLSQDRRPPGTRCGGNIGRPMVPGFVRHEREGGGFLGGGGQSAFVGSANG